MLLDVYEASLSGDGLPARFAAIRHRSSRSDGAGRWPWSSERRSCPFSPRPSFRTTSSLAPAHASTAAVSLLCPMHDGNVIGTPGRSGGVRHVTSLPAGPSVGSPLASSQLRHGRSLSVFRGPSCDRHAGPRPGPVSAASGLASVNRAADIAVLAVAFIALGLEVPWQVLLLTSASDPTGDGCSTATWHDQRGLRVDGGALVRAESIRPQPLPACSSTALSASGWSSRRGGCHRHVSSAVRLARIG